MTLTELNAKVAKISADAETQLREVLLAAAKEVQAYEAKDGAALKPVVLKLEGDVEAIIDAANSAISIKGSPVQKIEELLALTAAIQPKLGDIRVDVAAAVPVVETAVADAKADASSIVGEVTAAAEHILEEVRQAL